MLLALHENRYAVILIEQGANMIKSICLSLALSVLTVNYAIATEVEGIAARDIVVDGKVLGVTLFDDFFKEVLRSRSGFIYSVMYADKFWYCYNAREFGWFCETFE